MNWVSEIETEGGGQQETERERWIDRQRERVRGWEIEREREKERERGWERDRERGRE